MIAGGNDQVNIFADAYNSSCTSSLSVYCLGMLHACGALGAGNHGHTNTRKTSGVEISMLQQEHLQVVIKNASISDHHSFEPSILEDLLLFIKPASSAC